METTHLPGVVRAVVAAHRGDDRALGRAYQDAFAAEAAPVVAGAAIGLLSQVVAPKVTSLSEDPSAALADVHRLAVNAKARSAVLGDTNLVVLEHVIRSALGGSSYASTLDPHYAGLLCGLLAGLIIDDDAVTALDDSPTGDTAR